MSKKMPQIRLGASDVKEFIARREYVVQGLSTLLIFSGIFFIGWGISIPIRNYWTLQQNSPPPLPAEAIMLDDDLAPQLPASEASSDGQRPSFTDNPLPVFSFEITNDTETATPPPPSARTTVSATVSPQAPSLADNPLPIVDAPSATDTVTPEPTAAFTATPEPTATNTVTSTPTWTATPTPTKTSTATRTPTWTPSPTRTATFTPWPTSRPINLLTSGVILPTPIRPTPTLSTIDMQALLALLYTATPRPTATPTYTASPTMTATATASPTATWTSSPTFTATPLPTATPTSGPFPPAQAQPSRLVIPAIDLDTDVIEVGWDQREVNGQKVSVWNVAKYAAGWHKNSALPGHTGNIVLSGHHNILGEVFRYTVDLELGDLVTLYVDQEPYQYRVEDKFIIKDKGEPAEIRRANARWIGPFSDQRLTMITCWPYSNNTHRVIVIAKPFVKDG